MAKARGTQPGSLVALAIAASEQPATATRPRRPLFGGYTLAGEAGARLPLGLGLGLGLRPTVRQRRALLDKRSIL
jgi:hypothetical protein